MLLIGSYIFIPQDIFIFLPVLGNTNAHQLFLGLGMAASLFFIGMGAIHWAKTLMPDEEVVIQRHEFRSPDEDREEFDSLAGQGVSGLVGKARVVVGSPALLVQNNIRMEVSDVLWADQTTHAGYTVICVVVDGNLEALISIGDVLRPTSAEAVYQLQLERIRVGLLTGDAQGVADNIAKTLRITEVFAETMPWQKSELIKKIQGEQVVVGFVGDGINDAPALAQADVSFAIGAGTNVAIESAGIVLISDDPGAVVRAVKLSRKVRTKSMQNLWWAAGYNILAIPLAAGVFMPLGLVLTPAIGAVLMSLSTLIVAINAQTLRK